MRICTKCKQEKEIKDFYAGRLMCKKCYNMQRTEYYNANRETILAKQQNYNKRTGYASNKTYITANPDKLRVHRNLQKAVRDGRIIKPGNCSNCKKEFPPEKIQGHHHDYSKPHDVTWLCQKCHTEVEMR